MKYSSNSIKLILNSAKSFGLLKMCRCEREILQGYDLKNKQVEDRVAKETIKRD